MDKFQIDMFTNSRDIKYQNIEKSLSLIIERLVSMANKNNTRPIFTTNFCHGNWNRIHQLTQNQSDRTCIVACVWFKDRKLGDQQTWQKSKISQSNKQTDHGDQYTLRKSKIFCKVTNCGDQYTLRKSEILQSNNG